MKIADLSRKAACGTLEVEHLLQAAAERLPGLSNELKRFAAKFQWKTSEECGNNGHVPLATWAQVGGAYADGGLAALRQLSDVHPHFCIGLLEELRSVEAVEALVSWWPQVTSSPEVQPTLAWGIAAALNSILSFEDAPSISEDTSERVRQVSYRLYPLAATDAHRATALLMLRGVGDEKSLAFASAADEFAGAWADTKRNVLSAIRRRVAGANKRVQATRSKQRAPHS